MDDSLSLHHMCCLHEQLVKLHTVNNVQHLMDSTNSCFHGFNMSEPARISTILQVYGIKNSTYTFNAEQCVMSNRRTDCPQPTHTNSMLYVAFWLVLLLLTLTSNVGVIYAVRTISYLRYHVRNLFISSLAAADFFVAVFIIPIKVMFAWNNLRWCSTALLCRVYLTADNTFFSASITNLFVITVDRYLALILPYKYPSLITRRRGKMAITGVWMYGLIWGMLGNFKWDSLREDPVLIANDQCMMNNTAYQITSLLLVFYIPVFLMGFVYLKMLLLAMQHAKSIAGNTVRGFQGGNAKGLLVRRARLCYRKRMESRPACRKKAMKATKTVATVYGTFVICWFPVTAITLVDALCAHCFTGKNWTWFYVMFVEVLPILNSFSNPCIYALMNKQYRKAFHDIFRRGQKMKSAGFKKPVKSDRRFTLTASPNV